MSYEGSTAHSAFARSGRCSPDMEPCSGVALIIIGKYLGLKAVLWCQDKVNSGPPGREWAEVNTMLTGAR